MYDFSTNVVPGQHDREMGYWRDVGTIDSYFDANMDLLSPLPVFDLYNSKWPVFTNQPPLPPAKVSRGENGEPSFVEGSLLCAGSIVSGGRVERSIVSPDVRIHLDSRITDSILFPGVRIGAGATVNRCIIDKNVQVPPGAQVGIDSAADAERFTISDHGIVVIEKDFSNW